VGGGNPGRRSRTRRRIQIQEHVFPGRKDRARAAPAGSPRKEKSRRLVSPAQLRNESIEWSRRLCMFGCGLDYRLLNSREGETSMPVRTVPIKMSLLRGEQGKEQGGGQDKGAGGGAKCSGVFRGGERGGGARSGVWLRPRLSQELAIKKRLKMRVEGFHSSR